MSKSPRPSKGQELDTILAALRLNVVGHCRRALLERCIKDDFLGEQNEKDQLAKRWRREGMVLSC